MPEAAFLQISEAAFPRMSEAAFLQISEAAFPQMPEAAFLQISEAAFPQMPGAAFLQISLKKSRGMEVRRPREGARLGLFKNKVGPGALPPRRERRPDVIPPVRGN
jgi:hypothetical protein